MTSLSKRHALGMLAVAWLLLCLVGEVVSRVWPPHFTDVSTQPNGPVVQLRGSTIPYVRLIAIHSFFVVYDPADGEWRRYDLWQNANAGGLSFKHVHVNLMHPDDNVGAGPTTTFGEWRGDEAVRLQQVLKRFTEYPAANQYAFWPGPNSNTYPAWVFRQAGVCCDMPPQAVGKDYLGFVGAGVTTTGTGLQVESPNFGLKVGLCDGLEVHWLYFTFGIDFWTPALKTPLGRLGFAD